MGMLLSTRASWRGAMAGSLLVLAMTATTTCAKTTLSFWYSHSGDSGKGVLECIKDFEKKNPGISVKTSLVGWGDIQQKLAVAVSAGAAPDVVIFDRFWIGRWTNLLTPLDKFIVRDKLNKADYFRAAWDEDCYEGHVFGIPMEASTGALFANQKLLAESGMGSVPQTFDELLAASAKLIRLDAASGNPVRVGFSPVHGWSFWYHYLYSAGGQLLTSGNKKAAFNSKEGLAASEWILKCIDLAGGLGKISSISNGGDPLVKGKLAFQIGGSWDLKGYLTTAKGFYPNLSTNLPPSFGGKPRTMMVGGFAAVIPKGTKRENDAWKLAKYLGGPDGQRIYCGISWQTPSLKRLFNDSNFQEEPRLRSYYQILDEFGWYRPVTPVNSQMWDIVNGTMWNAILNKKKSPSQALSEAEREVNTWLNRYVKK